ncbi:MAG: hypothetical protein ACREUW_22260, partial [Burkholderiales bacterium]
MSMSSIVSSHLASQVFVSRLLYASAFAIHGFAIHGCDVAAASTPFTATPTGYDIASSEPAIAWLDGNHVIFVGKKSNPDPKKSSLSPSKMYLWSESKYYFRVFSD